MTARTKLSSPLEIFHDIDGQPLEDGYIYIGTAGLDPATNPITVYWDQALTTAATQPIRTTAGFPVNAGVASRLYTGATDWSLRVSNKNNTQIHQDLNAGANGDGGGLVYVDNANSRVGIGTTSPTGALDVTGGAAVLRGNAIMNTENPIGTGSCAFIRSLDGYSTASTPDYSFWYNDNCGMFHPAADIIAFSTLGTEKLRIDNLGNVLISKTSSAFGSTGVETASSGLTRITVDGGVCSAMNRLTDDGNLVDFYQDSSLEGSISVSGTTVSYNGAHLSRWSQLTEAGRPEILRGSVMSNLDDMCVWPIEAQDAVLWTEDDELPEGVSVGDIKTPAVEAGFEDNEQLNKLKVSDVEGDKNVAGVFQGWDSDDDENDDFYVAMTGDFVIRIGAGETVARGDLLMSAGDGTAKAQDDDIVRSKTIAKVTSTNVAETYADGSYLVPCVLMAC